MEGHGSAPTAQEQKDRTPGAMPGVTPVRWEGSRLAGHAHAPRCAPAAGHLSVAFRKRDAPKGAAAQLNPQSRKPGFTHPWATGRPVPRGAGHGPRRHGSPGWHAGDSPARGVAQRGSSAPECQRHRGTGRRAAPAGPGRDSHVWEKPRSPSRGRGKRSSAGQAPGTAAPARPPRQSGRRPRSPGGDFDPAAGRACRHLLPAGCAAAAAAPPPSGTPTEEPLLAPAPRGRSVPPAGAPAAGAAPRPAALPELGNKLSPPSPSRCRRLPAELPRSQSCRDSRRQQLSWAATHPRARRREGPRCPAAQPGSSSHTVPRQRLPRRCAGGPTTF
ncbi:basic salivary proline-rich protein 4-like [Melozone crissalis]|uniref:basic salivary proline-rich protein 4-like n=1 Tax=Melozone crissalis TaxID=40204 RepID=UPI0023DBAAF6|nr:basic salivary proline-rich protein 4-like [Melozone crissalis]